MESSSQDIINQGWLYKRSRYLNKWRKRWTILTSAYLITYKSEAKKKKTEKIILQDCTTIKSVDEELKLANTFRLDSRDTRFYFRADDQATKDVWVGAIGKRMIKPGVLRSKSEEDALDGRY
jgi:PH domain